METSSTPPTPVHPGPNEEVRTLPDETIPQSTLADIDLNPDLYDDSQTPTPSVDISKPVPSSSNAVGPSPSAHPHHHEVTPTQQLHQHQHQNSHIPHVSSTTSMDDSETDMEEVDLFKFQQITLPFDEAYQLFKLDFESIEQHEPISHQQQSKFVNYIDEQLLQIQRKFIKSQAETNETYSFGQLIQELTDVINIIWVSVCQKNTLFGQMDYYIKILGDLEDYLEHYRNIFDSDLTQYNVKIDVSKMVAFFKFFQKLDLQLSLLMDGFTANTNQTTKASNTELIRLYPIISRLRILIISRVENLRTKLNKNVTSTNRQDSQNLLNLFELEISRLFEGILERSS
ncbi:uncharacterized protein SPAPADRAFT_62360 [Spathaspora passalidarum NRRL Y-27907]|uniref:Uncharacterized protein n=1 Tax=Spathaspora passalidarum (strain NRRL Y-27907 / 11-Y1) TaxID=619300 RepID=G3ARL2_SPAPN|nr:uncharacterized protein SPAPADRAFT_62360 [Spathaspora passalidarum NRRL Y-27907]EGW31765.1 hypothetical protein SPAPADRAFT_62360 [Spathaspora passalidarum NRRL Y-27907]